MVQAYHLSSFSVVEGYILDRNAAILSVEDEEQKLEGIVWRSDMPSYASTSVSAMVSLISRAAQTQLGIFSPLYH